eukprot:14521061-Alexandrium_andersonii.AAC.1
MWGSSVDTRGPTEGARRGHFGAKQLGSGRMPRGRRGGRRRRKGAATAAEGPLGAAGEPPAWRECCER